MLSQTTVRVNQPLELHHFGNTANNSYYHREILRSPEAYHMPPIKDYGVHAMSAPAWDFLDFSVHCPGFIDAPDWSSVPSASELHNESIRYPTSSAFPTERWASLATLRNSIHRFDSRLPHLQTKRIARGIIYRANRAKTAVKILLGEAQRAKQSLRDARRTVAPPMSTSISLLCGPAALVTSPPRYSITVALEHGTVRWIERGAQSDAPLRSRYEDFLRNVRHLWITNLDEITIEAAEKLAPGRWAALPHPYVLDPEVPFAAPQGLREKLLHKTSSEFLILLPASMNWLPDHNKGSLLALNAFTELRDSNFPVGLVVMRWGRQVAEAEELLKRSGVANHVEWLLPQPRKQLQRLMAAVDMVWDQFAYACFGATTIKAMEQAVPLLTHSMSDCGTALMGERPPFLPADSTSELLEQTRSLLDRMHAHGRLAVRSEIGYEQRSWLLRRHHHGITRRLLTDRYSDLLAANGPIPPARPDAWARLPDFGDEL